MRVWTIGTGDRTAAQLFEPLATSGVEQVLDVRMDKPEGFGGLLGRADLAFLVPRVLDATYAHEPLLAPTEEVLRRLEERGGGWDVYREEMFGLFAGRRIEEVARRCLEPRTVLLCSSPDHAQCHRSLIIDYLSEHWESVEAVHL